ncbi:hypothetical protein [Falsiroseomonas selenitidurans]|uniref:L-lactate permease n=1 Tax=Falsiroseomonas selenitidurans TaxID=2716335 RepID=A0ABX1ECB4_9PROT|nr:hypothetical protein [Falsiroseomonas selenitidurans]NKC34455.1 hypothetical protein [Falsiroseomonas selenitidurans]
MSSLVAICLAPLTLFFSLVRRAPWASVIIGSAATVLAFATRYGTTGAVLAMFVGSVLIWLGETGRTRLPEPSVAAGD